MHTPVEVTMEAMKVAAEAGADGVIAIGGGSTTGLSKAIALRTDLPQLIVPTTYAGSEMTPILGQTENGSKTTLRDNRVLPETVIYDVSLTLGLPVGLSAVSGLNAIAHAVEALYARDRNPVTRTGSAPWRGHCRVSAAMAWMWRPARMLSTAHGSAASAWVASAWRSITSFATRWAACSTCRMPKPTA